MNTSKQVGVYIGRFQPFHLGHFQVLQHAVDSNKFKHIILLLGSSEEARTPKNPFSFEERKQIIENIIDNYFSNKGIQFSILPIHDFVYDNQKWIAEVQNSIASVTKLEDKIVLIGNLKDRSSNYLKFFPHFNTDFTAGLLKKKGEGNQEVLGATEIRKNFFELYEKIEKQKSTDNYLNNLKTLLRATFNERLNEEVIDFLVSFCVTKTVELKKLVEEYSFIKSYRKMMEEKLPYKNIAFFTGDALVTCAGHLLLVKRKIAPGKGLYALPGGFFDGQNDLNAVDTAIRELKEETNINLPKPVLYGNIVKSDEFGDFERSQRWRIITKATYIKLPNTELPYVKGGDDAAEAIWMPFSEIKRNRDKFFEDHLSIIDTFLNII